MLKNRGVLCVFFADTHTNSKSGLCPWQGTPLDGGGHYTPSELQCWYWEKWVCAWKEIERRKREKKCKVWGFSVGDGSDDNRHGKYGLISLNETDIVNLGEAVLEPVRSVADSIYVLRGTEAHTRGAGALEELVAHRVGAVPHPELGSYSWYHALVDCQGVLLSVAHHAKSYARLPWTQGGGVSRSRAHLQAVYAEDQEVMAYTHRLGVRAHGHYAADSGAVDRGWRMIFCPPWQAQESYGWRLGNVVIDPPGMWIAHCHEGQYELEFIEYEIPRSPIHKEVS